MSKNINMAEVKPYSTGKSSKKEEVEQMFDNIADKYDFNNHFLSLGIDKLWRKAMISKLRSTDKQILDLASGTGDVAIRVATYNSECQVIGVDLSAEMLKFAVVKAKEKGLKNVRFEKGDAENLGFDSNSFDAVTIAFGVRNFGDLKKGLSEILRVLRTDGQLLVLEFSHPTIFPFRQLFNCYFRYILPKIGNAIAKDSRAYQYLFESVQSFPCYERFGKILEEVGFKDIKWKKLSLGICSLYIAKK